MRKRPRTAKRLREQQFVRVWNLMKDGKPREPAEIEDATGDNWASASARLRDMRKKAYGAHTVAREHVSNGVWRYQLRINRSRGK